MTTPIPLAVAVHAAETAGEPILPVEEHYVPPSPRRPKKVHGLGGPDGAKRRAFRVLGLLADLGWEDRERVLAEAVRLNRS
jgi:hypothetical protein